MFKFIHAADIHLDSPLRGLSRYESTPTDSIRNACRRSFQNLINLAIEEKVAFVLLAGDLYDGNWKDYSTGIFLSQQIGRLRRHDISVFAVSGNHDAANQITKALETPTNMKILSSKKVDRIRLAELGVVIHGRSFESQHVDENLAAGFDTAENGLFNIGLLHTSLDGREGHAVYAPCSLDDLLSKGYQYWALGHVHKQEFVSEDPWIVFPGCIQGRHIHESGAKGCVIVNVVDGNVSNVERIALDVLRWSNCYVELTDVSSMREILQRTGQAIEKEFLKSEGRPLAMRIHFQGATKMADDLASYPERLEHQIKALGTEICTENLWIERVENNTVGKLDLESTIAAGTSFGKLLKEILATKNNPEEIGGVEDMLVELRQKMPVEAFGTDSILNIDDPQNIQRIIEEAKHMLVGRLLTVSGDK